MPNDEATEEAQAFEAEAEAGGGWLQEDVPRSPLLITASPSAGQQLIEALAPASGAASKDDSDKENEGMP
jgi:hypothetical protein